MSAPSRPPSSGQWERVDADSCSGLDVSAESSPPSRAMRLPIWSWANIALIGTARRGRADYARDSKGKGEIATEGRWKIGEANRPQHQMRVEKRAAASFGFGLATPALAATLAQRPCPGRTKARRCPDTDGARPLRFGTQLQQSFAEVDMVGSRPQLSAAKLAPCWRWGGVCFCPVRLAPSSGSLRADPVRCAVQRSLPKDTTWRRVRGRLPTPCDDPVNYLQPLVFSGLINSTAPREHYAVRPFPVGPPPAALSRGMSAAGVGGPLCGDVVLKPFFATMRAAMVTS